MTIDYSSRMDSRISRVFISYARTDGTTLARQLQQDLVKEGFDVWMDTTRIAAGTGWTKEIEDAIDASDVALALLTKGSYASEICRAEHLRALRKGTRVIPLLAQSDADRPLYFEAAHYVEFAQVSLYSEDFRRLVEAIQGRIGAVLREKYRTTPVWYITAPPIPANYIERAEAIRALRDTLFTGRTRQPIALTALAGMGGIGKTVLAQALIRDQAVLEAFPDGIIWLTLGRESKHELVTNMRQVAAALADDVEKYTDELTSVNRYKTLMARKAVLLVMDDVWSKKDLEPFLAESQLSRLLFTTRDASIARFVGAQELTAELFHDEHSRQLLATWAGLDTEHMPSAAGDVINECGNLPLALAITGATLRGTKPEDWADMVALLKQADLRAIEAHLPVGQDSFFRVIEISVKALSPEIQQHYKSLAVLPEDMAMPMPILRTLWHTTQAETRQTVRHLIDRSLAQRESDEGSIRLHTLQHDYVRANYPDRDALQLIRNAIRLSSATILQDPFQFPSQMVARLLAHRQFPRIEEFLARVSAGAQTPWLRPVLPALHPPRAALTSILEGHSESVNDVFLIADGYRAISASSDQTLKLWDLEKGRELHTFKSHNMAVQCVAVTPDGTRAVSASYEAALVVWDLETGREMGSLQGHSDSVLSVAVCPDGQRAVSGSRDSTLKVWDLGTGRELQTLRGHSDWIEAVAASPDGRHVVSASCDGLLKVWDLETGRELRNLRGHSHRVNAVAVSPDGRLAVSGSMDRTLKVWDLGTGRELQTLEGHLWPVLDVTFTPDGRRAISASNDNTIRIWDIGTGRELRCYRGHGASVNAVKVSSDGRVAISASDDKTLRIWNLGERSDAFAEPLHFRGILSLAVCLGGETIVSGSLDGSVKWFDLLTGEVLRALPGHSRPVCGIAALCGPMRFGYATSASYDNTLRVWDLETGGLLRTLEGHTDVVNDVVMLMDWRPQMSRAIAVSASRDKTLKIWDVKNGREVRTLRGHSGWVEGVALFPDYRRVMSASADKTLKIWDLQTGRILRTLDGHSATVNHVALSSDGRLAVSASSDKTLRIWDAHTGRTLRTLQGHSASVNQVALSSDGRRAVSASDDKTLKVWDIGTGVVLSTFTCDGAVHCCAFHKERNIFAGDALGRLCHFILEVGNET